MADFELRADTSTNTVTIDGAQIEDRDIAAYFDDVPNDQREERLQTALLLGVIALKSTETAARVDFVEKRFNELEQRFQQEVQEVLDKNRDLLQNALDPNDDTPLGDLNRQLSKQISQLGVALGIEEGKTKERQRSALKGQDFEAAVQQLLGKITGTTEDTLELKMDEEGFEGSKKGDFVLTLNGRNKRIVFEAKDQKISKQKIEDYMTEAITNRDAVYGVYVAKHVENLPQEIGWFREYNGDILILALGSEDDDSLANEIIEIGYKWARRRVLDHVDKDDIADVWHKIETAERSLEDFNEIKKSASKIESSAKDIWERANTLKQELDDHFQQIHAELDAASDPTS